MLLLLMQGQMQTTTNADVAWEPTANKAPRGPEANIELALCPSARSSGQYMRG